MKQFVMALVAVSFFGSSAFARSILPAVVSYEHKAVSQLAGGASDQLVIYASGQVVYRKLQAIFPAPEAQLVGYVSADKVDQLNRLVENARKGKIVFKPSMAMCFAMATHTNVYKGDMGQVLLSEGAHCAGGFRVNQSPSAKILVNYLDRVRAKFNIPGVGPKKNLRPTEIRVPIVPVAQLETEELEGLGN